MITILLSQKIKQSCFLFLLLLLVPFTNGFAQDVYDGEYCPGPGQVGDEYANGIVFSQQLSASPSSTCEIGTIRAKVNTLTQVLRLGMNIGNGGAALFRLYLDTDNNPSTGLTSDTFGGSLSVAGAEYIIEINSNASTFNLYSGNGSTLTPLPINNGLAAKNGSAIGCNAGGGEFLEFNIPFGSIGINICDSNNPGLINITKLASVSGNSTSSSRCINTALTFGIPLKGSIDGSATVCSGTNSTNLEVKGLTTGSNITKWQSSVTPFLIWSDIAFTGTTYPATNLTQTTKFRAIFNNSGLCAGKDITTSEATVTVVPQPTVTGTQNVCVNSTTALSGSGTPATSNPWVSSDGSIATVSSMGVVTGVTSGTAAITYTNNNGCQKTVTVTVNPLPIATITGNAAACANSTSNVYTTESGMTDYLWEVTGGTITSGGETTNNSVTVTWNAAGIGHVKVNYTNVNNCTAVTQTDKSVTINALPIVTITGNAAACANSTSNVYTTESGMTDYLWEVSGGTITLGGGTNNNSVTVTWNAAGTGHVKVNYTNVNSCTAAAQTDKSITINPLPIVTITGNAAPCANSISNVYTTEASMTNYLWEVNGGTITAGGTTADNTITVTWGAAGTGHVKVNYTNANSCTAAAQTDKSITINPPPIVTITGNAAPCANSISNVYTTEASMTNYLWEVTGGTITAGGATADNTVTITWGAAGTGHVKVNYTNANSCTAAAQTDKNVTVNPLPDSPISAGNITQCQEPVIQTLTATAIVPQGQSIEWYDSAEKGSMVTNPTLNTVGTVTYFAQAVDNNTGCISKARTGVTLTISPCSIELEKTGVFNDNIERDGIAQVDETITYTFAVTNNGDLTISNINISDITNPSIALTFSNNPIATLAPGASASVTGTYKVTQADIDAGLVNNEANATGQDPNGQDVSHDDGTQVDLKNFQKPSITLEKTGVFNDNIDSNGIAQVDETITYTFAVTNNGNVTISNINITDITNPSIALTFSNNPIATLAPGASASVTGTYKVTQADIDAGLVNNEANATGQDPNGQDVSHDDGTQVDLKNFQKPSITLEKTGVFNDNIDSNGIAQVDETITYTFAVTNNGNVTISNINITDITNPSIALTFSNNPIATLAPGASASVTGTYKVTQADIDAGLVNNEANATGQDPNGQEVSHDDGTQVDLKNFQKPSITLEKTGVFNDNIDSNGIAQVDETITYTFAVTNNGNVTISNINITDITNPSIALTFSNNPIATLAPGASASVTGTYKVTQADIDAGLVNNEANATGQDPNGQEVSHDDGTQVDLKNFQKPSITLEKTGVFNDNIDSNGIAQVDETITYTFAVTNNGNVTISNINITDITNPSIALTFSNNPIATLAPGASASVTGTYKVTQADIDAGLVNNEANATGQDPNGQDVSHDDGTQVDLKNFQKPSITLEKTGVFNDNIDSNGIAQVDETITYTFAVTNNGNVTISNINITDITNPSIALTFSNNPIATLAPGASASVTGTYKVTQADIDAGLVNNEANATGQDPNGQDVSHDDGTQVDLKNFQKPSITLEKTGVFNDNIDSNGIAQVDETITYTFAVTNNGNVTISNINITDITNPSIALTFSNNPIATLAPGASASVTGTYKVTQADIDAGLVNNEANATGQDPNGQEVSHDDGTQVDLKNFQKPSITLEKTGVFNDNIDSNGIAQVDETITYTFAVTNNGNVTISNINITDITNPSIALTFSNNPIATLAPGASASVTGTYKVTQADIDAGLVNNEANATGQDPNGQEVSHDDGTQVDLKNFQKAEITLVKIGVFDDKNNDGIAQVGETINYSFEVKNTGNLTITNIIITDELVSVTGGPILSLPPNGIDNSTFMASYVLTQTDIDDGFVTNIATATGQDPNQNDISGSDEFITDLSELQKAEIALLKTAEVGGTGAVGDIITYTFTVTNLGNVIISNINITDITNPSIALTFSSNPIPTLAPKETKSIIGTYIITQADIDLGKVTNSALAVGKDPNGNDVEDVSGTTFENDTPTVTTLTQNPSLTVIKTANSENYSSVGDIINYTIIVRNTGNVTLFSIAVKDPLTGLDTVITSLAPGISQEYTQNYTVTQSDRENGTVTNVATANGFTPNQSPISASDDAVVEAAIVLGCETVIVHNAFSPNGDGINEWFVIENIEDFLCYPDNTVEIYNRWGVLVYETRGYNNTSNVFDGTSEGRTTIAKSSGLPTGVYFYILNYTSLGSNGALQTNRKDGYLYLTR